MKTNNNNTATSAATVADLLFEGATLACQIAATLADMMNGNGNDYKAIGKAIGEEWQKIGGDVETSQPIRLLIEACSMVKGMTKKETSKLVNAANIVSRQRVSQLIAVIFDGDKSKNYGNKTAKDKAAKDKADGESQEPLDKMTFDQILAALKSLPSITQHQAEVAASILASKIA